MHIKSISRRQFLSHASFATAVLGSTFQSLAAAAKKKPFEIIAFSKPFQKLKPEETADFVAEVGWSGIECPVRARGQIEPERVEEDLPILAEAFRKRNLRIDIISTDIEDATNPLTPKVLRTASKLGIQRYRLKHFYYNTEQAIPAQLQEFKARLSDIVQLNKEIGIAGGIQNHSGNRYVGAPVWDIWQLVKDYDPRFLGVCFDIGHATLEGGYSWPIEAKLIEPHLTAVFVKDFFWQKGDKGWKAEWCPLGEGMVNKSFFEFLQKSTYAGPICQHHEYKLGDQKQMLAAMKKDLQILKGWLSGM